MEPSLPAFCCAVMVFTVILWLLWQAWLRFHRTYLFTERNPAWMWTEKMADDACTGARWVSQFLVGVIKDLKMLLHNLGCLPIVIGAICLHAVKAFWGLVFLTFSTAYTALLLALTLVCSIPGLIYGMCLATRDTYDALCPLAPSHTLKPARQA